MAYLVQQAVRDVCLWLPETEEFLSHGSPNFRVRGKTYATFVINHHGDGRVALWLNAAPEYQALHVGADPRHFFVPPYVGPRGWLGVHLNKGLSWKRIAALVRDAYERVAPASLTAAIGQMPVVKNPTEQLTQGDIDPMRSARGKALLKTMRRICLDLPQTREALQFGFPVWQAGKKTFASARSIDHRLCACFWVGVDRQQLLTSDPRFLIPSYMGHNGWIAVDVADRDDPAELAALALQSYRHFALKRMLQSLETEPSP
jgi:predicted DNA-binding protein (MmcQ/YjbR family)